MLMTIAVVDAISMALQVVVEVVMARFVWMTRAIVTFDVRPSVHEIVVVVVVDVVVDGDDNYTEMDDDVICFLTAMMTMTITVELLLLLLLRRIW